MQQQRISNNDGLVTAASYARLRGLNRSTVSRQIAAGVIPTHDGLVNPSEADERRASCLDRRRGRRHPITRATASSPRREWDDAEQARFVAWKLCKNAREFLPEMMADCFPTVPDPAGEPFALRVFSVVVACGLLEGWGGQLLAGHDLPPVAWEHFGNRAEEARVLGAEFWRHLFGKSTRAAKARTKA